MKVEYLRATLSEALDKALELRKMEVLVRRK